MSETLARLSDVSFKPKARHFVWSRCRFCLQNPMIFIRRMSWRMPMVVCWWLCVTGFIVCGRFLSERFCISFRKDNSDGKATGGDGRSGGWGG